MPARSKTDLIVIHCSATPSDMDIGRDEIDRWHKKRGWAGVGYHFVITRKGGLEYGRDAIARGAHAGPAYNGRSIGICLIGGVDAAGKPENNFTDMQWMSLQMLVTSLKLIWPAAKIIGHNEIDRRACPSFDVQAWVSTLELAPEPLAG